MKHLVTLGSVLAVGVMFGATGAYAAGDAAAGKEVFEQIMDAKFWPNA